MKKITVLLSVFIITIVALTACGGVPMTEDGKVSILGSWIVKSTINADGVETIIADLDFETDEEEYLSKIPYEFNEDGTFSVTILGTPAQGTYEFDGETLTMTIGGADMVAQYKRESDTLEIVDEETSATTVIGRN